MDAGVLARLSDTELEHAAYPFFPSPYAVPVSGDVHDAIRAGGVAIIPPGGHNYAEDYGPSLENAGFTRISTDNYVPQKGDVVVFQSYSIEHPADHIQMYDGTGWISDFVQSRPFWPGAGYEMHKPPYAIYRP
jgi:hypothetical protein